MRLVLALALILTLALLGLALLGLVLGSGAAASLAVAGLGRGAVVTLVTVCTGGGLHSCSAVTPLRDPLQVAVTVAVVGRGRVLSPPWPG